MKPATVYIVQISSVVEPSYQGETLSWNEDAIIYGLGDDQLMYYWGRTKTTRVKNTKPDEDGLLDHFEHEWGWKVYQP